MNFRNKPDNFDDKDVYVCESRYATKARSFKKMKVTLISLLCAGDLCLNNVVTA